MDTTTSTERTPAELAEAGDTIADKLRSGYPDWVLSLRIRGDKIELEHVGPGRAVIDTQQLGRSYFAFTELDTLTVDGERDPRLCSANDIDFVLQAACFGEIRFA